MGGNAFPSPGSPLSPFSLSLSSSARAHACVHTHTHTLTRTCCAVEDSILQAAGWLLWVVTPRKNVVFRFPCGRPRSPPLDCGLRRVGPFCSHFLSLLLSLPSSLFFFPSLTFLFFHSPSFTCTLCPSPLSLSHFHFLSLILLLFFTHSLGR